MKRLARVTLPLLLLGLVACGGSDGADKETQALRKELSDLRQQLATTSTTTASTTTATEPPTTTTTTTIKSTTTTVKSAPTPTTTGPAPTTTAPPPSTTTTTEKYPQGIVSWSVASSVVAGNCGQAKIHLINRSDTPVRSVTFHGPFVVENYKADDGSTQARWGITFPEQTVEAGLSPLGGTADVDVKWCPSTIGAGTTSWSIYYGSYKDGKNSKYAFLSWDWFGGHGYHDCRGGCISYQNM